MSGDHVHVYHGWDMGVTKDGVPYEIRMCRCGHLKRIQFEDEDDK